ncbi:hypothetical protein GZH49_28595 [Nocardia terpenica]
MGSEITFVWGPLGTGKTEVVGCIMESCSRQGLRILFVAPTHVAVDHALERLCELLCGEEGFDSGLIQRVGEIAVPSLSAKFGDVVIPDRIAQQLSAEFVAQIAQADNQLAAIRVDIALREAARTSATLEEQRRLKARRLPRARRDRHRRARRAQRDCRTTAANRRDRYTDRHVRTP